jgi:hypothetical protein
VSVPATSTPDAHDTLPSRVEHVCAMPHIPEAVSAVRRRARTVLAQWRVPTLTVDDALLVISELTTNAIVHLNSPSKTRPCAPAPPSSPSKPDSGAPRSPPPESACTPGVVRSRRVIVAARGRTAIPSGGGAPARTTAPTDRSGT